MCPMDLLDFTVYLVVSYFFWDMIRNQDEILQRKVREPWVRKIRY